jgi:DNA-directed RNA polymerase specialized sigma24 family protein
MQLSVEAITKLLPRAYRFAFTRIGDSALAEQLVLQSLSDAVDDDAPSHEANNLEHRVFDLLHKRTGLHEPTDHLVSSELSFTFKMQEPGRGYFLLRHVAGLTADLAGSIAGIPPERVAETERESLWEAAELLGLADAGLVPDALAETCHAILAPETLETAARDFGQAATLQAKARRRVPKLAVLAAVMSLLIVLFIVGTKITEHMRRFPGYEKVAALLSASEHPGVARERSPMNGHVSALEDWFIINHGGENLAVPPHLAAVEVKACRVFQHGPAQILEAELRDNNIFLYLFRGEELGVSLASSGKPHVVSKDGWAGLVQADAAGNFALLATKGSRDAIDALISKQAP